MNVESSDIVWVVNKSKKWERYSPIDSRGSAPQRFSLTQWRILQHRDSGSDIEDVYNNFKLTVAEIG